MLVGLSLRSVSWSFMDSVLMMMLVPDLKAVVLRLSWSLISVATSSEFVSLSVVRMMALCWCANRSGLVLCGGSSMGALSLGLLSSGVGSLLGCVSIFLSCCGLTFHRLESRMIGACGSSLLGGGAGALGLSVVVA